MLFADIALAARIEKAECDLVRDCAAAIASRRAQPVVVRAIAGGVAVHTGEGSPLNKVAGLGFAGELHDAELESIEREFAAAGAPIQVELSCLAEAGVGALLIASHESVPREVMERVMSDLASAPSLARYLARRGGAPAGGASMRASDGICQLCGAATLPEHRRHGVQSAMLARRLDDAARAGCDVAVVTTLPGSKSQQNVQRLGFELLYARAILVLA